MPAKNTTNGAAEAPYLVIEHDGRTLTFRSGEVTGVDAMDLRRLLDVSVDELLGQWVRSPGADTTATLVWLARRQAGERVLSLFDVANTVKAGDEITIRWSESGDVDPTAGVPAAS